MGKLNAIGMTCGIGSMLIGARNSGFNIVGNVEWRKYYPEKTFTHNFPRAFFVRKLVDMPELPKIDLLLGHPECGNFSILNTSKNAMTKRTDAGDIPVFIEGIKWIKPSFFVMDNLPMSILAFSWDKWQESLGDDYYFFFEWISNYHYGNSQKGRNRLFVIGCRKDLDWVFVPGETPNNTTTKDWIGDLPLKKDIPELNHVHRDPKALTGWYSSKTHQNMTYVELAECFLEKPPGKSVEYYARTKGHVGLRPGYLRTYWDKHMFTITGGGSFIDNLMHNKTGMPLTTRERARLQGCPDDFCFFGDEREQIKQTGKFMPVQFCEYVSRSIFYYLTRKKFVSTGERLIKPNKYIDEAKLGYCKNVGYPDHIKNRACAVCWVNCHE